MAQVLVTESYLDDIADAIREKNGSEDTYTPAQMAGAIEDIQTADEVVLVSKSVTVNGTYNPASDSADGYSGVTVNVPNSYAAADEGKVVSSGELVAQTSRNVSQNGTYDTTTNNMVVVNVEGGGGGGGERTASRKLLDFDFTQSLTDTVQSYTPDNSNVTQDSFGLHFNSTNAYIKLPKSVTKNDITIEVDVLEMSMTSGTHRRFIICDADGCGLIYNSSGKWALYLNRWYETSETDPHLFDGKTVKIIIDTFGYWHVYVDENLLIESPVAFSIINTTASKVLTIGSPTGQTIYDSTITGLRVFANLNAELVNKTITQNGTYNPADDNADGYSSVTVNVSGGGSLDDNILRNGDFTINTTGVAQWDASNSGTSSSSRYPIIDDWEIMQCIAEKTSQGITITPSKSYAYLTQQIKKWYVGKNVKMSAIVNGSEYNITGVLYGSGTSLRLNTSFGQIYVYAYSFADIAYTLMFDNQIGNAFIISNAKIELA